MAMMVARTAEQMMVTTGITMACRSPTVRDGTRSVSGAVADEVIVGIGPSAE